MSDLRFFLNFCAVSAPFWLHFDASEPHLGSIFYGFRSHFGSILAAKLTSVGWAGEVTRSVKNFFSIDLFFWAPPQNLGKGNPGKKLPQRDPY